MTPIVLIAAIVAIWIGAAVLWLLDAPRPSTTVDTILSSRLVTDETVAAGLKVAA